MCLAHAGPDLSPPKQRNPDTGLHDPAHLPKLPDLPHLSKLPINSSADRAHHPCSVDSG